MVWYNLCNSWSFTYRKIKNFIFKLSRNCNSNYNECRNCIKCNFISLADGFNQEIVGLLFGSISAVNLSDLITITIISIVVLLFILLLYKELFILSFDEEYSKVINIPKWIQFLFITIVAMVISASMRVVGILLVSALITLPVAIAMRLTKGFKQLIILSIVIGECSVILGLTLAFYINISPGGVIVVLLVLILGITMLLQKTKRTAKRSIKL